MHACCAALKHESFIAFGHHHKQKNAEMGLTIRAVRNVLTYSKYLMLGPAILRSCPHLLLQLLLLLCLLRPGPASACLGACLADCLRTPWPSVSIEAPHTKVVRNSGNTPTGLCTFAAACAPAVCPAAALALPQHQQQAPAFTDDEKLTASVP